MQLWVPPHIIQPTRLTENTATCIDNIFSNNIQDEIVSGNILFPLSEHLSQFVSVKREKIDEYLSKRLFFVYE